MSLFNLKWCAIFVYISYTLLISLSLFHQINSYIINKCCFFCSLQCYNWYTFLFVGEWSYTCVCVNFCYIYTIFAFFSELLKFFFFFLSYRLWKSNTNRLLPFCSFVLHLFFHSTQCVWWLSLQQTTWVQFSFLFLFLRMWNKDIRYNKKNSYKNVYKQFQKNQFCH